MAVIGTCARLVSRQIVYVFDLDSKAELLKLAANDGADDHYFGMGVQISGNIVMVAAPKLGKGAVYTFDALNGKQLQKFTNYDTPASWWLGVGSSGMVVHSSKNVGIVGHRDENRGGALSYAGAVYVFDLDTGAKIRKIRPAMSAEYMKFGASLFLSGDFLLVGAPGADFGNGRVYVFDVNANWMENTFFGPSDNQAGGRFGASMAMSGPNFIITAYLHSSHQKDNGAVYVGNYSKFIHMSNNRILRTCVLNR